MSASEAPESSGKIVVLSIRFPESQVKQGKAVATVTEISFNELVRRASELYIRERVTSEQFKQLSEAYVASTLEQVRMAFGGEIPSEIIDTLSPPPPSS